MVSSVSTLNIFIAALACFVAPAKAAPTPVITETIAQRASNSSGFLTQNGLAAQQLNLEFTSLQKSDSCTGGENGCIAGSFAQCVNGQWQVNACSAGTSCFALPLVNSAGTSIVCDSQTDALARIQATGVSGGLTGQDSSNSTVTSGVGAAATANDGGPSSNDTISGDPGDDGSVPCDGESNSTSTTSSGDESAAPSTVIVFASQAINTASSGTASPSALISPSAQAAQAATTIQLTAQSNPSSYLSSDSASQSATASTGGYYIKLNKRQLVSSVALASSTPLPTPTNAASNTSTAVSSTPSGQSILSPFAAAPAISAPPSAGSPSTSTGADGTVTVTVTANAVCTGSAAGSALALGTSSAPGIFTSSTPTSFLPATSLISSPTFTPTSSTTLAATAPPSALASAGGDSPLIPSSTASSVPGAVAAAASVPLSSTTSSSAFHFAVPTTPATTTANNIANTPINSAEVASMLTATI